MMRKVWPVVAVIALVGLRPASVLAADKTHQQIMAEIRMLQEQQQQLQQLLGGLGETLKALNAKIDEQSGATRKAFADQKLLVDNVADGVRILREKADDTNVRLSSMTQELETLRQTIASMPAPGAAAPAAIDPVTGTPAPGASAATTPATPAAPPLNVSHQKVYDLSYADYTGGQWDLAITGFQEYIRQYPGSPLADDAQLNIGNAYYGAGKYKEAAAALQKVISDYPQADTLPTAYYKLGQAYEAMKQPDLARKTYDEMMQKFPNAFEASLARQALERLNRKEP
jgi:tol-pal system protein YbgF